MLDKYYHTKDAYYSHDKMVAFLKGELEDYERRAMEKLIDDDPFLRDALEGIKMSGLANTEKVVHRLHKKTDILTGERKPVTISLRARNLAMAAMLLVFLTAGWYIATQLDFNTGSQTAQEYLPEMSVETQTNDPDAMSQQADNTLNEVSQSKQDEGEKYPAIQKEMKKQEVTLPEPVESVSNYEVQEDLATGKDTRKETYDFSDTQVTSVPASAEKRSVKMEDDSADEEFMVTDAYLSGTPASESDAIFITVEVMPQYPGGDKAMQEFIRKELRYPAAAKDASIQGTVYVNFVVDATGEVGNIKLIRGIGGGCDEEAMKMVSKMPKWKPGRQNGKNVPVSMTIPVQFKLQ